MICEMKLQKLQPTFTHWRWQGIQWTFCRNKSTVNEQIVEILIHSSIENFQPELLTNSEPKADEMHVSPDIANAM